MPLIRHTGLNNSQYFRNRAYLAYRAPRGTWPGQTVNKTERIELRGIQRDRQVSRDPAGAEHLSVTKTFVSRSLTPSLFHFFSINFPRIFFRNFCHKSALSFVTRLHRGHRAFQVFIASRYPALMRSR